MNKKQEKRSLRSQKSYGKKDKDGFIHRSWMKNQGLPQHVFDGRPVIGICNTWSELTPCNTHLRDLADSVKKGVWEAGGLPLEFPAMSLGETQMRPTAMLFRNLLSMDVEESIRGNPIDGVVLLGGCDKTTPGQLMGAASVNLPTLVISSGPMLNGKHKGKDIGSGTDVWKFSEAVRAGQMSAQDFFAAEEGMSRSPGTCMTMGTASTVACLVEALGLSLPYNGTLPAVDARRKTLCHLSGMRIVEMVHQDQKLSHFLTRESFENAIACLAIIGGSTNAILHLLAIAGRVGCDLNIDDFDRLTQNIPLLVNTMPSGKYLMEDFHYAGGLPAALSQISKHLHLNTPTVSGQKLGQQIQDAQIFNSEVIATFEKPIKKDSGLRVLYGNLCPKGAIIKPNAASEALLQHRGKAYVFENIEELKQSINDPKLPVDKNTILVLKGCGPIGYPGMPEVGNMPIPKVLAEQGIKDMVRISDARMSGTAFGTVVLHISPESSAGGPLGVVETGDEILLDVSQRKLELLVDDDEIQKRLEKRGQKNYKSYDRGYYSLYQKTVLQAHEGADLDFLRGNSSSEVERESH
ncbi:MAG: dihydroxy-acid dehydratase [Bdellovibrionales bacterium]|nr:dihydroxy-acid dehydratase [Bdellovibrionales bacterium]